MLAVAERMLGASHAVSLLVRVDLGHLLWTQDRYAEAEVLFRTQLAAEESIFGPEDPETLLTRNNVALMLQAQGRSAEAVTAFT